MNVITLKTTTEKELQKAAGSGATKHCQCAFKGIGGGGRMGYQNTHTDTHTDQRERVTHTEERAEEKYEKLTAMTSFVF